MRRIIIGKKDESKNYDFRETCFGIVIKNNKMYCTEKKGEISLIGGGVEKGESYIDCLKREFLEEAGCYVESIEEFCIIDCFWLTRNKKNMESLANIYIVNIADKIVEPTEFGNKLIKLELDEVLERLELPYQKRAIEEYLTSN